MKYLPEKELYEVSFSSEDDREAHWFQTKDEAVEYVTGEVEEFLRNGFEEVSGEE